MKKTWTVIGGITVTLLTVGIPFALGYIKGFKDAF